MPTCHVCKAAKDRDGYRLCRDCAERFFETIAPVVYWMVGYYR
jgi:hypothetical protein